MSLKPHGQCACEDCVAFAMYALVPALARLPRAERRRVVEVAMAKAGLADPPPASESSEQI